MIRNCQDSTLDPLGAHEVHQQATRRDTHQNLSHGRFRTGRLRKFERVVAAIENECVHFTTHCLRKAEPKVQPVIEET